MTPDRLYTVLVEPHISEKASIMGDQSNRYAFKVRPDATKAQIRRAVEQIFEVRVVSVTTLNVKGKVKRSFVAAGGGRVSRFKSWKKAYVRLEEGQEIDFMAAEG